MEYAINDKGMEQCMLDDLEEIYNYSAEEAKAWISQHDNQLVSDMWDAYSSYMEINAIHKDIEDDN